MNPKRLFIVPAISLLLLLFMGVHPFAHAEANASIAPEANGYSFTQAGALPARVQQLYEDPDTADPVDWTQIKMNETTVVLNEKNEIEKATTAAGDGDPFVPEGRDKANEKGIFAGAYTGDDGTNIRINKQVKAKENGAAFWVTINMNIASGTAGESAAHDAYVVDVVPAGFDMQAGHSAVQEIQDGKGNTILLFSLGALKQGDKPSISYTIAPNFSGLAYGTQFASDSTFLFCTLADASPIAISCARPMITLPPKASADAFAIGYEACTAGNVLTDPNTADSGASDCRQAMGTTVSALSIAGIEDVRIGDTAFAVTPGEAGYSVDLDAYGALTIAADGTIGYRPASESWDDAWGSAFSIAFSYTVAAKCTHDDLVITGLDDSGELTATASAAIEVSKLTQASLDDDSDASKESDAQEDAGGDSGAQGGSDMGDALIFRILESDDIVPRPIEPVEEVFVPEIDPYGADALPPTEAADTREDSDTALASRTPAAEADAADGTEASEATTAQMESTSSANPPVAAAAGCAGAPENSGHIGEDAPGATADVSSPLSLEQLSFSAPAETTAAEDKPDVTSLAPIGACAFAALIAAAALVWARRKKGHAARK